MIAHDRQIAENTASNRQRLCGNTFQWSGNDYMETLFSDRAIVGDCERFYASVIPAIRRSWAVIWKPGFMAVIDIPLKGILLENTSANNVEKTNQII